MLPVAANISAESGGRQRCVHFNHVPVLFALSLLVTLTCYAGVDATASSARTRPTPSRKERGAGHRKHVHDKCRLKHTGTGTYGQST